jgi:hypothetical protein
MILQTYFYDINDNLISFYEGNDFTINSTDLQVNLNQIIKSRPELSFNVKYKFKVKLFSSIFDNNFDVEKKSNTGLELFTDTIFQGAPFDTKFNSSNNLKNYYVNFGNGDVFEILNWLVTDTGTYFKLFDSTSNITSTSFLLQQLEYEQSDFLYFTIVPTGIESNIILLDDPNIYIHVPQSNAITTDTYKNWNNLITSSYSTNIVNNYFGTKSDGINLLIDYSDFNNFIYYSKATDRLTNFKYKISKIEEYNLNISLLNSKSVVSQSIAHINTIDKYNSYKNDILSSFDGFEYYMYNESSSYVSNSYGEFMPMTWPKINNSKPYSLYPITSSEFETWYEQIYSSASYYDQQNLYNLEKLIPEYILDDEQNMNYVKFVDMVSQIFDTSYLYIKHLDYLKSRVDTNYESLTKDLVLNVLQSLGWDEQEEYKSTELYQYLFGVNNVGTYVTQSVISIQNEPTPYKDITQEIWKRILNNLTYIYKTKGTKQSVRALLNCYGIPDSILDVKEYGGYDKTTYESYYEYDNFGYSLYSPTNSIVHLNVATTSLSNTNRTIEFRFKINNQTSGSLYNNLTYQLFNSASILADSTYISVDNIIPKVDSTYSTISLSTGSVGFDIKYIPTSNTENGSIKLYINDVYSNISTSYTLFNNIPINNDNWWYFSFNRSLLNNTYSFISYVGYNDEYNNVSLYSSSFDLNVLNLTESCYIGKLINDNNVTLGTNLDVYLQELKYWNITLNPTVVLEHISNPLLRTGNNSSSSFNDLIAWFPLGIDLKNNTSSIYYSKHSNLNYNNSSASFQSSSFNVEHETIRIKYPNLVTNKLISNKVRIENTSSNNNLSYNLSFVSSSFDLYPDDSNKIGVYFDQNNEINFDIANVIGNVRIDSYLYQTQSNTYINTYPELDALHNQYLLQLKNNNDINLYNTIANQYNSSMFRKIKDLVPAKANLLTGIVVENDILYRNKLYINNDVFSIKQPKYEVTLSRIYPNVITASYKNNFITTDVTSSTILNVSNISNLTSNIDYNIGNIISDATEGAKSYITLKKTESVAEFVVNNISNLTSSIDYNISDTITDITDGAKSYVTLDKTSSVNIIGIDSLQLSTDIQYTINEETASWIDGVTIINNMSPSYTMFATLASESSVESQDPGRATDSSNITSINSKKVQLMDYNHICSRRNHYDGCKIFLAKKFVTSYVYENTITPSNANLTDTAAAYKTIINVTDYDEVRESLTNQHYSGSDVYDISSSFVNKPYTGEFSNRVGPKNEKELLKLVSKDVYDSNYEDLKYVSPSKSIDNLLITIK